MAARVGTVRKAIEGWAWADVWGSGRSFFTTVALVVCSSILLVTLATAGVARRNGEAVEHARDQQRVATSLTEFRRHLSTADAQVAIIIAAENQELPLRQTSYEDAVLQANRSLTEAGLVAAGQSVEDIEALSAGLVRYGGLVQTAREYPANSSFAARASARRDCLSHNMDDHPACRGEDGTPPPTADSVRLSAEEALSTTAASGADGLGIITVAGLVLAAVVLSGTVLLVAGRTRRWLHWSFSLSAALLLLELALAAPGLWSQHGELATVVRMESDAYAAANEANLALLDLRTTELKAVTADDVPGPEGQHALYDRFQQRAQALRDHLDDPPSADDGPDRAATSPLSSAIEDYEDDVEEMRDQLAGEGSAGESPDDEDTGGQTDSTRADRLDAAALTGGSASAYGLAHEIANSTAVKADADLTARLDAAAQANVDPWTPLLPGVAAAFLAGLGVLHRGRRTYRRGQ